MVKVNIDKVGLFNTWVYPLKELLNSEYFQKLLYFISKNYKYKKISPSKMDIFKPFELTNFKDLKVVILNLEPYHFNATGLAFANEDKAGGIMCPSLSKIKECIEETVYNGLNVDFDPTLESWADQGVLLLNTALTVEVGHSKSHIKYWERFTREVIEAIDLRYSGIVFMFWGKNVLDYKKLVDDKTNYIFECGHPIEAYLSGNKKWECDHFKKANLLIEANNGVDFKIKW
tara:strand:+ start:23232 stop:23924 length:693 start_codon:yes stop_codon:yes gene_type:complete